MVWGRQSCPQPAFSRLDAVTGLPLGDRHPSLADWFARIVGAWADQPVIAVLFQNVRRPSGHAAYREDRRKEIDRNAQRIVSGGRVKIHVGIQALLSLD